MLISFTVYGTPKTAGSKRAFYKAGMKRAIVIEDNDKESRSWKHAVASAAREVYTGDLLNGALRVSLRFFRPRPKGHFGKRGLSKAGLESIAPTSRPDVLKLARAVEDALSGVLWRDDSQIVVELLAKDWGEPARVEIRVELIYNRDAAVEAAASLNTPS